MPPSRADQEWRDSPPPDARLRSLRLVGGGSAGRPDWLAPWPEELADAGAEEPPEEADGPPAGDGGWTPRVPRMPGPSRPPAAVPAAASPQASGTGGWDVERLLAKLPLPVAGVVERLGITGCAVLLVMALVAAGLGAGVWLGHRSAGAGSPGDTAGAGGTGGAQPFPDLGSPSGDAPATGFGSPTASVGSAGPVVVDVEGRVRRPGLVSLPTGARVADAIAAAGGLRGAVRDPSLDLAAKVGDGQLLVVGRPGAQAAASTGPGSTAATGTGDPGAGGDPAGGGSGAPLDINTATDAQLEALPGVGPVLAGRILSYREAHGPFTAVSQLQSVPGIGPSHFAEISPLVTT